MTATVEPGSTRAVLSAAPTPVVTPQPISASCSWGSSVSTFTTLIWFTVICSANVPRPVKPNALLPSARVAFGSNMSGPLPSQRFVWPCMHQKQWPHAGTKEVITLSPTATRVTSEPIHSTVPLPSWPRMHGGGVGMPPFDAEMSEWQTPLAPTRMTTSEGPGSIAVTSSTESSGSPVKMAARMTFLLRSTAQRP